MIRVARFFVDQVGEQLAAGRLIVAARVHGGEIGRESGDVPVILAGVISQRGLVQFTSRPGEIKGMGQEMAGGDLLVEAVKIGVHKVCRCFYAMNARKAKLIRIRTRQKSAGQAQIVPGRAQRAFLAKRRAEE